MSEVVKIKIQILITLAIQTAGLAYMYGAFSARTESRLERCLETGVRNAKILEARREWVYDRTIQLESEVRSLNKQLERILEGKKK